MEDKSRPKGKFSPEFEEKVRQYFSEEVRKALKEMVDEEEKRRKERRPIMKAAAILGAIAVHLAAAAIWWAIETHADRVVNLEESREKIIENNSSGAIPRR